MALQFNPTPYLAAFQFGQNRNDQYRQQMGQALQAIPQGITDIAQIPEKQKQDRMNQLLTAMKLKEQGINPGPALNYMSTGQFPQADAGQASSASPMFASAGTSDTPQQMPSQPSSMPQQPASPVIQAWNNHPDKSQFAPKAQGFDSLLQTQPIDPTKTSDINYLMSLPESQRAMVEKTREFQINQEKLKQKNKENPDYDPQDLVDAQNGNFKGIAARHGGVIPHSFANIAETASSKADSAYEKKRLDAQNAFVNVRGDQSIARTELQRDSAAMAYNTIERIKSENRLPTPLEYHDLLNQMLKARTGSFNEQAANELDQKTLQGRIGNLYSYFTGKTAPATTADLLDNLQKFVTESGLQAEKQHESYMAPRQSKILRGLRPEDQQQLLNVHRGMSFQEQTGYNPTQSQPGNNVQQIGRFKVVAH